MKKYQSLLLIVSMLFLMGCSSSPNNQNSPTDNPNPTGSAIDVTPESTPEPSATPSASATPTPTPTPTLSPAITRIPVIADSPYDSPSPDDFPSAGEVASSMGVGLNLGNTMEAYNATNCEKISFEWIPVIGDNKPSNYETCWGAVKTTQEVIDGIKAAGFDTVRIPVFWGNMMENDGTWTIHADYIARVKEIVDYCLNDDLYVVINIHHFDEFIIRRHSTEECAVIFDNLWRQIANYFRDYPPALVFEGFNEYLGGNRFNKTGTLVELSKPDAYKMTNTLNQSFVDAVRSTGGNNSERVLIVSGYWTNIDNTTSSQFHMPADTATDKLMVSVHYVDNSMYWQNKIGGAEWVRYIDNQCEKLIQAFSENNIPVFLGETTSRYPRANFAANPDYKTSSECLDYVLGRLTEHGFVPVLWDTNNNFYSRTLYQIVNEEDAAVIRKYSGLSG